MSLLYFPLSPWFSSTLRPRNPISAKDAVQKYSLFPLTHRRTDWETQSEGPSSSHPLLALPFSLLGLSPDHSGLLFSFVPALATLTLFHESLSCANTAESHSQGCHCFYFLLSRRSMAVHGRVWWSPKPVQDKWWERMPMSRVHNSHPRVWIGKSLTEQHAALQLIHTTVSLTWCKRFAKEFEKEPLAVSTFAGENFHMRLKDQIVPCLLRKSTRAPTCTCSHFHSAVVSWELEGKKNITAGWQ